MDKYPQRPITLIVPTGPGASPDLLARALDKVAPKHLGQPLEIINIPGNVATRGWNQLAGAGPDGYTIGLVSSGLILAPLFGPTEYHYPTAIEPLVQVTALPIMAVTRADRPWQNLMELIEYGRQHPGTVKFGHMGPGSPRHITGELFARAAGLELVQVPYDSVNALPALLAGEVQILFTDQAEVKEYVRSGLVKVLAVAAARRLTLPLFDQVPTFSEQGAAVEFGYWFGVGAPGGMPAERKGQLATGLGAIIQDPAFVALMDNVGLPVSYLAPPEFAAKWDTEQVRLADIINRQGLAGQGDRFVVPSNKPL